MLPSNMPSPESQPHLSAFTSPVPRRRPGAHTIWIDLDNSPHVPFFAPIIDELARRGYAVVLTARDAFQVRELADLFRLDYKLIGRHSGRNPVRKVAGLCLRALQLAPTILEAKPALAVSHGSRSQLIASTLFRLPSLFIGDYEFSRGFALIHPTWHMCPEVIPDTALPGGSSRILRYPGIKEDVYVPRFIPNPHLRTDLGLREQDLVVTLRPPATEAHYHTAQSDELFAAALEYLSQRGDVKLVVLPRTDKQTQVLRALWPDLFRNGTLRVPDRVVDGLNLIWHSDLVISGGGTMNREAAALGVPVYSVFRGRIGAVDRYLSMKGRLVLLESPEDVRSKIRVVRRARPVRPEPRHGTALDCIVDHIVRIMGSLGPRRAA
jgi:predicted glycosyltransferase